jgi:hypothetical protein
MKVVTWHVVTALCVALVMLSVMFRLMCHAVDAAVETITEARDLLVPYPDPTPEQETDEDL